MGLCAMHILKARSLLQFGNKQNSLDLSDCLSRPSFGKSCCYSNTVMRLPLREKIQNAINRVLNDDGHVYNDCNNNDGQDGAFKVGGRRRNRKKKKNNKKNGQKKKKSPSLESIKAKLSPPRCRKGSSSSRKQEDDVTPLISDEEDTKD